MDRLPVADVTDRHAWAAVHPGTRDGPVAAARAALAEPPPALPASGWARTFRDGVRTEHEDAARAVRQDVALQVVAAVLTGDVAPATDPPGAPARTCARGRGRSGWSAATARTSW